MTSISFDSLDPYNNQRAALACVALRWHVIGWSYRDGRKVPLWAGWTRGNTITSEHEVWDRWIRPDTYPGVVTGPESRIFVIDTDGEEGRASLRDLEAQHGSLPSTFTVRDTPGSGGDHRYLVWPSDLPEGWTIRNSQGELGTKVDVRGQGGFVVAPGTRTTRGLYAPPQGDVEIAQAPPWLINLVAGPAPAQRLLTHGDWVETYRTDGLAWFEAQRVEETALAPPGKQEQELFRTLCYLRSRGRSPEDLTRLGMWIVGQFRNEAGREPWSEVHVRVKVSSAMKYPGPTTEEQRNWVAKAVQTSTEAVQLTTVGQPAAPTHDDDFRSFNVRSRAE